MPCSLGVVQTISGIRQAYMTKKHFFAVGALFVMAVAAVWAFVLPGSIEDRTRSKIDTVASSDSKVVGGLSTSSNAANSEGNDNTFVIDSNADKMDDQFVNSSVHGPFTIYPQIPIELYEQNINAAHKGDMRSQYNVARALHECTGTPDRTTFEGMLQDGSISLELAKIVEESVANCTPLFELVSTSEIDGTYQEWMKKSVQGGDALAASWNLMFGPGKTSADESRKIVIAALKENEPVVYYQVAAYVANRDRDSVLEEEAWVLMGCRRLPACIPGAYESFLKQEYYGYQVEEIFGSADRLEKLIDEKDWDSLGL